MSSYTEFKRLGNLAFYDANSKNANNYFYFKSLGSEGRNQEYNERREIVKTIGTNFLNQMPSFASDDGKDTFIAAEKIDELISFIEKAVKTEQDNEIAYFKNKIATLKGMDGLDKKIVKQLSNYLSEENFNYNKVITLINVLQQGTINTKAIVEAEKDHINKINDRIYGKKESMEASHISKLNGLWDSKNSSRLRDKYAKLNLTYNDYIQKGQKKYRKRILVEYVEHGNLYSPISKEGESRKIFPGAKKWLESVEGSIDTTVAHWVTDSINAILKSKEAYSAFVNIMQSKKNFLSMSPSQAAQEVKSYLIQNITVFATKNLSSILNNAYSQLKPEDLINIINEEKILDLHGELKIEGLYDNFGMFGLTADLFKDAKTIQDLRNNDATNLYEIFRRFRKEIKKLNKSEVNSMQKTLINIKGKNKTNKYDAIYNLISQLESIQKHIEQRGKKGGEQKFQKWLEKTSINLPKEQIGEQTTIKLNKIFDNNGEINISSLINELQGTRAMKNLGGRKSTAQSLQGLITGLKVRTSNSLKNDLVNLATELTIKNQKTKGNKAEQLVIKAIQEAVENKKISVGAPTFSEIKQGIQESLRSSNTLNDWIGKLNKKNDFVVAIYVDDSVPDLSKPIKEMIDQQAKDISEEMAAKIKKISEDYVKNFVQDFYNTLSKSTKEDDSFNSYKANADAFFNALKTQQQIEQDLENEATSAGKEWKQYKEQAEKRGDSEEEMNEKRKKILDVFGDSFFESSTMKTYNQYQNDIGFIGGSLGANLQKQLDNINEIFTAANMPINEQDMLWLKSAIINCSPNSLVGEKNKNIIEDYLGSLIVFALFDEGSAEAEIIAGVSERVKTGYTTPKILHLYAVNGIYVPGSFVLNQTLEELKACRDNAYKAYESSRRGGAVTIINHMNEGMIKNRNGVFETDDPWGDVAAQAEKAVSIKILFLAGLLDIANNINKTLSNIQLPG